MGAPKKSGSELFSTKTVQNVAVFLRKYGISRIIPAEMNSQHEVKVSYHSLINNQFLKCWKNPEKGAFYFLGAFYFEGAFYFVGAIAPTAPTLGTALDRFLILAKIKLG